MNSTPDPLVSMVIFELNHKEYAIPVNMTREVLREMEFVPIPNTPSFIRGVINLRGSIICVLDLRKQFQFPIEKSTNFRIIAVEIRSMVLGLIVDSVKEILKIPRSQIDSVPTLLNERIPGNCLVGIARNGQRIITLLNLENILSGEQFERLEKDNS
jgi:purine-binding chemotaxis protein CheW